MACRPERKGECLAINRPQTGLDVGQRIGPPLDHRVWMIAGQLGVVLRKASICAVDDPQWLRGGARASDLARAEAHARRVRRVCRARAAFAGYAFGLSLSSRSWMRLSAVATMLSSGERGAQPRTRRALSPVAFLDRKSTR